MPLAAVSVSGKVFIVEKDQECNDYEVMKTNIKTNYTGQNSSLKQGNYLSKKDYQELLSLSDNASEKQLLKHTICSAYNMSKRNASRVYGIGNVTKRAEAVKDAALNVADIKQKHKESMKLKQEAFLISCGLNPNEYFTSDSDSGSDSDSLDDSEVSLDSESGSSNSGNCQEREILKLNIQVDNQETSLNESRTLNNAPIETNSAIVLEKLRLVNYNWFAFVAVMETFFRDTGSTSGMLNQFLDDFASRVPGLGLSDEEVTLTENSRTVYIDNIHQMENDCQNIPDSNTSGEEESSNGDETSVSNSQSIKNKLKKIRDRYRKKMTKEIQVNRFLRKKITRPTKTILSQFPDIGEESDIGADRWRRTGVYTFSGNPKKSKRMTFGRIQQELESYYGRRFSYGTVVQLCVPRHKRRLSSKRYKGVANVKYQKARKGFTLKYNPDCKWSRSMYKLFKQLQQDGTSILLLNRDDQAGFRLDSTFTHKNFPVLSLKPTNTTRTDFLNKYPTQLQTTCYNFTKTETSDELCAGVVKASKLHEKNPSQHADDIIAIEGIERFKSAFYKENSQEPKEVECIQVDGAGDEGPSHMEVQFIWTERHMSKPTKVTLVTTRCSGDSFLNRVELQNGCLSRGHSNLFIPSTLLGSNESDQGGLDEEKHKQNMSAAIDQYISRVDGTPCMRTHIHLIKGPVNQIHVSRRKELLTFLKGTKKEKEKLKHDNPTLFEYFTEIWDVRNNHIDESLPVNYMFMLKCCSKSWCKHPLCQQASLQLPENNHEESLSNERCYCICEKPEEKGKFMISCDQCGNWFHVDCVDMTEEEAKQLEQQEKPYICPRCIEPGIRDLPIDAKWFPAGPSFSFFPYPVADKSRPFKGTNCKDCTPTCYGHYVTDLKQLLQLHSEGKAVRSQPPSQILANYYKRKGDAELNIDTDVVQELSRKCLLPADEIKVWLKHLQQIAENRRRGTEKANATRRKKKKV